MQWIAQNGFAVFVASYMLLRMEKTIREYSKQTAKTNQILAGITLVIQRCERK